MSSRRHRIQRVVEGNGMTHQARRNKHGSRKDVQPAIHCYLRAVRGAVTAHAHRDLATQPRRRPTFPAEFPKVLAPDIRAVLDELEATEFVA